MVPLTPFIVTVTFDAGATRRDFSERFKTLSEAASYAETARAMEDVWQIAIDFRLSERSFGAANRETELGATITPLDSPPG